MAFLVLCEWLDHRAALTWAEQEDHRLLHSVPPSRWDPPTRHDPLLSRWDASDYHLALALHTWRRAKSQSILHQLRQAERYLLIPHGLDTDGADLTTGFHDNVAWFEQDCIDARLDCARAARRLLRARNQGGVTGTEVHPPPPPHAAPPPAHQATPITSPPSSPDPRLPLSAASTPSPTSPPSAAAVVPAAAPMPPSASPNAYDDRNGIGACTPTPAASGPSTQ